MQQLPVYHLPYFPFFGPNGGNAGAVPPVYVLPTGGQPMQQQQPMVFVAMTPAMAAALGLTNFIGNNGAARAAQIPPLANSGGLPSPSDGNSVVEIAPIAPIASSSDDIERGRIASIIEENRLHWMEEIEAESQEFVRASAVPECVPAAELPPMGERITVEELFNCPALQSSTPPLSFYESTLSRAMGEGEEDGEEEPMGSN